MNKSKTLVILFVLIFLVLSLGLTYSIFYSKSGLKTDDQNLAKFVVNAEVLDELELSLIGLKPGSVEEYLFSISNNQSGVKSDVSIEYEIIIKTYSFLPLEISLYKVEDEEEELILTCDDSERDLYNNVVCISPSQIMEHDSIKEDDYLLKVSFPEEEDDYRYALMVDFINLEIDSAQIIEK